jgi:hypothetical protein
MFVIFLVDIIENGSRNAVFEHEIFQNASGKFVSET